MERSSREDPSGLDAAVWGSVDSLNHFLVIDTETSCFSQQQQTVFGRGFSLSLPVMTSWRESSRSDPGGGGGVGGWGGG